MSRRAPWSCGGCDTRWTSLTQAHCVKCHRQFASAGVADHHDRDGVCKPPEFVTRRNGDPVYTLAQGIDGPVWRRFNRQDREFA